MLDNLLKALPRNPFRGFTAKLTEALPTSSYSRPSAATPAMDMTASALTSSADSFFSMRRACSFACQCHNPLIHMGRDGVSSTESRERMLRGERRTEQEERFYQEGA